MEPENLHQVLARSARDHAHRGVAWLDRRGEEVHRLSWAELHARAQDRASRLARARLEPGAPVLIALGTSPDLLEAWLACVLRGALPVLTAPPLGAGSGQREVRKLARSVELLEAPLILADGAVREALCSCGYEDLAGRLRTPEDLAELAPLPGFVPFEGQPEELAFLQLTSGSTGVPRAVSIRHGNILHQVASLDRAVGLGRSKLASSYLERLVSWLPLHHDMGLVGCFLFSMYAGFDLTLLAPRTFLARPMIWVRRMAEGGPALTAAPNFAYQTCVERFDAGALGGASLEPWEHAFMGAEMVRKDTGTQFAESFASHGFRANALQSCYGLAEATLAVTFDGQGEGLRTRPRPVEDPSGPALGAAEVVCSGAPIEGTELSVRAPDGRALEEGRVGEVWVRGGSVFAGYYGDGAATTESLRDGWLATGDLGFLEAKELYLTGRTKDLLILNGQNWMPHELEWCAEHVTGSGGACRSAAFSVTRGAEGEQAVLLVETEEKDPVVLAKVEHEIRKRVGRELGLVLADLRFARRGRLPKTSSGKVQRSLLAQRYAGGTLDDLGLPLPRTGDESSDPAVLS